MLSFADLPNNSAARLHQRLSPALADFRVSWESDVKSGEEWNPPLPVVTHAMERWIIPRGISLRDSRLDQVLEHGGRWHVQAQVERKNKPNRGYYVRLRHAIVDGNLDWDVEWIGYRWHAPVAQGIAWMEANSGPLGLEGEVRLLSSSLFKFTSFWLESDHRHLVVSSAKGFLPNFELLSQDRLQDLLVERFGSEYGRGGVDPSATT